MQNNQTIPARIENRFEMVLLSSTSRSFTIYPLESRAKLAFICCLYRYWGHDLHKHSTSTCFQNQHRFLYNPITTGIWRIEDITWRMKIWWRLRRERWEMENRWRAERCWGELRVRAEGGNWGDLVRGEGSWSECRERSLGRKTREDLERNRREAGTLKNERVGPWLVIWLAWRHFGNKSSLFYADISSDPDYASLTHFAILCLPRQWTIIS